MRVFLSMSLAATLACASSSGGGAPDTPVDPTPPEQAAADLPVGFGTLHQEDIALRIQLPSVLVRALPLDESVIRVLSPDSYRGLHGLVTSRQAELDERARRYGVRQPSLWYFSYYGVQPDARFSPEEVIITSAGRVFRPLSIVPLTTGFGEQRLEQRGVQTAIYIFDDGVDVNLPLVVTVQGVPSSGWEANLRRIERERALVRSRAAARSGA
ncbi:MAG TPA: hypothetical protein VJ802_03360 [Gemmatimonadaceae bacterium]|nr:hypothetical protein [Gemmatimonadaceae bacterium]